MTKSYQHVLEASKHCKEPMNNWGVILTNSFLYAECKNASIFLNFTQIHLQTWLPEANHC